MAADVPPLDPDEDSVDNDDAPEEDPFPAPPREADVAPFEPKQEG